MCSTDIVCVTFLCLNWEYLEKENPLFLFQKQDSPFLYVGVAKSAPPLPLARRGLGRSRDRAPHRGQPAVPPGECPFARGVWAAWGLGFSGRGSCFFFFSVALIAEWADLKPFPKAKTGIALPYMRVGSR